MAAGKEIKRLREAQPKKLSVAKAAGFIGIDSERLRKWEQRDVDPTDKDDITKVETYFGRSLKDLDNLDSFQFYQRYVTGNLLNDSNPNRYNSVEINADYIKSLKDQIQLLKEQNDFLKSTIKANLENADSDRLLIMAQLRAQSHLQADRWAAGDTKKYKAEIDKLDRLVGDGLKLKK